MDLKYLMHKALDELEGAEEYIKMGVQIQPMSKEWGDKLYALSTVEMEHAKTLFGMYQELYKKTTDAYPTVPKYLQEMNSEFTDEYMDQCTKVKLMQDVFKK